jgi:hypothetical protein
MAGKAKSCYLTVADKKTHKSALSRVFLCMGDLNDFVKTEEFLKKYPAEQFYIVKETY